MFRGLQYVTFEPGSIFHLREADLHQEIYGLPEWISALQSALLNESATLFRRKYYESGSHAGFILYMTDAAQTEADIDALCKALKDSKGAREFSESVCLLTHWQEGRNPADPCQ